MVHSGGCWTTPSGSDRLQVGLSPMLLEVGVGSKAPIANPTEIGGIFVLSAEVPPMLGQAVLIWISLLAVRALRLLLLGVFIPSLKTSPEVVGEA